MGVTIHFEGKLKGESSYNYVLKEAEKLAKKNKFQIYKLEEEDVKLLRVKNEEEWYYYGPVKGVEMFPHQNSEPLRLEFDRDLYIQEFVKTQYAPIDTHILIIKFLRKLSKHFLYLEVFDEGEFFETNDVSVLELHRENIAKVIDEYLTQDDKYYGPVRHENGRITDVMKRESK